MRRTLAMAVSVALALAIGLPTANAQAEKIGAFMFDGKDASHGIEVDWAELVMPRGSGRILVRLAGAELTRQRLNAVDVWLDVRRGNPGPEFRFEYQFRADRDGYSGQRLRRYDTWSSSTGRSACPGARVTVDYARDNVRVFIPKRCVGSPRTARFSVTTWQVTRRDGRWSWTGRYDDVPAQRRMSGWANSRRI